MDRVHRGHSPEEGRPGWRPRRRSVPGRLGRRHLGPRWPDHLHARVQQRIVERPRRRRHAAAAHRPRQEGQRARSLVAADPARRQDRDLHVSRHAHRQVAHPRPLARERPAAGAVGGRNIRTRDAVRPVALRAHGDRHGRPVRCRARHRHRARRADRGRRALHAAERRLSVRGVRRRHAGVHQDDGRLEDAEARHGGSQGHRPDPPRRAEELWFGPVVAGRPPGGARARGRRQAA